MIQSNPKLDDSEIASLMYDLVVEKKTYSCNIPNTSFVKNIRAQMDKNGGVLPEFEIDPTTKFVLSVTDQLAEVKRTGENRNFLELSLKMKRKVAKLIFKLPNKERYLKGKPCLPDIVRTAKNKQGVAFDRCLEGVHHRLDFLLGESRSHLCSVVVSGVNRCHIVSFYELF